jgi:hypothetical protein
MPLTIASKILGINLTKEVKDLYNAKYKSLKKGSEENSRRWKDLPAHGSAESVL